MEASCQFYIAGDKLGFNTFDSLLSVSLLVGSESVSYADGTSWHATDGRHCRVSVGSSVW